ncbi:hypothetical protein NC651_013888 [Populus alba x Populus x berolinensis]|nr:hypothetical protein NC651_013888 [Populus alba x Populus x berolinensis]
MVCLLDPKRLVLSANFALGLLHLITKAQLSVV